MELGLWSSVAICLGFSFLLIGVDEVIHARRKRRKQQGTQPRH